MKKVMLRGIGFSIRTFEKEDYVSLAYHANNKKIWDNMRDLFPHPYSEETAKVWIKYCMESVSPTNFTIDVNGLAVGGIGIIIDKDVSRYTAEFGYWLGEDYWGKGIMTKVIKRFVSYIFEERELMRLHCGIFQHNKGSMRVLEKAGFEFDGVFKKAYYKNGVFGNEHRYSIVKED